MKMRIDGGTAADGGRSNNKITRESRREVEEDMSVDAKHDRETMMITRESMERVRQRRNKMRVTRESMK